MWYILLLMINVKLIFLYTQWLLWIPSFHFRGPDWEITIDGKKCCIKELLVELYEKVCFLITLKVNIIRWYNVWLY